MNSQNIGIGGLPLIDTNLDESTEGKKDFLAMLNNPDFSDITLIVDGHPIYSH